MNNNNRQQQKERPRTFYDCRTCGTKICFDDSMKSASGKPIPLVERTDSAGQKTLEPHQCPNRSRPTQQPQPHLQPLQSPPQHQPSLEWQAAVTRMLSEITFKLDALEEVRYKLDAVSNKQSTTKAG